VTYNVLLHRNEFGDILSAELIDVLVEDLWERTGPSNRLQACTTALVQKADAALTWRFRACLAGSEAYLPAVQLLSEFCRKTQLDSRVLGPGERWTHLRLWQPSHALRPCGWAPDLFG